MVRLEGVLQILMIDQPCHFNSKMVRLEDLRNAEYQVKKSYFNSKMVRLEDLSLLFRCFGETISIPKWYDQKSHMVGMSVQAIIISIPKWYDQKFKILNKKTKTNDNFNSKMVRLEVTPSSMPALSLIKFQFQNGTIRSRQLNPFQSSLVDFNSKMVRLEVYSPQLRTVKSRISIPKWYDQKNVKFENEYSDAQISIPKWYDQKFH